MIIFILCLCLISFFIGLISLYPVDLELRYKEVHNEDIIKIKNKRY